MFSDERRLLYVQVCDDDNADSAGGSPSASGGDDECVFGVTTLVHLNYHKVSTVLVTCVCTVYL